MPSHKRRIKIKNRCAVPNKIKSNITQYPFKTPSIYDPLINIELSY